MLSREKVVKGLEIHTGLLSSCKDGCPYFIGDGSKCKDLLKDALSMLKEQEAKTGHWIEKEDYNLDTYYDCSVCGESWTMIDGTPWENGMYYCPHCGAKMEGR